jgi:hypothetical protein
MWFAYVDESFNADRYWVAAVLVHHQRINATHRALRDVIAQATVIYGLAADAELHGHEIFHAEDAWEPMKELVRARIGVYAKAFRCLGDARCRIIFRGVARPGLARRYGDAAPHPQRVTMTHLIERVDEFAQARNDYALIVADEHHETQSALLRDLITFQDTGTWGYRGRRIQRVVDTIHFVNSATNPLVQAADLVAFLKLRRSAHTETDDRAQEANEHLWGLIASHVGHNHCWYP